MERCVKCQGSLRIDREFPGIVCQRCGLVYYFNPYVEPLKVGNERPRRGGWHRIRESETVGELADPQLVAAGNDAQS